MIERVCPICGKTYLANPQRLKHGRQTTCSRECSYAYRGKALQTYIEIPCQRCGKLFKVTPNHLKRNPKYCSWECLHPPVIKTCQQCGGEFRVSPSAADQQFCSARCANSSTVKSTKSRRAVVAMWSDPQAAQERREAIKRRSQTPEWRSAPHFQRGEKHPRYNGNRKARKDSSRYEYKAWRKAVFMRDHYTCQKCGAHGVKLNAHHIWTWRDNPDLRFKVSNGITLCEPCHAKIHGKEYRPKTYHCVDCGKQKTDGRRPRCRSCAAKHHS